MKYAALALLAAIAVLPAQAQDKYPSKPINMLVPFAAGGSSDVIARLVGEEMAQVLGQRIVMENMGGAGGATALTRAARAEPDGYTIVIGNSGTNAASYTIYNDLKYTPADFVPVGLVAKTSPMIALKLDFPAKDLKEFLAYAKANPGKISLGHAGVGSSNYLICRNFLKASGLDVALVSYRGAGPALNDLISGNILALASAPGVLKPQVEAGTVRVLANFGAERVASFPDTPTFKQLGFADVEFYIWAGLFAPAGLPPEIVTRLRDAMRQTMADPAIRTVFERAGSPPAYLDAPEFARFVAADSARLIAAVKKIGRVEGG